ncbi:MAG: hypothetical protein Q4P20_13410 [Eubacteriales bacterium]|nr:hypothetical protein [Eubacteriales bacterium]
MRQNDLIAMRMNGKGLDNDGLYWSEEDRKTLVNAFESGIGVSEIALLLKRSETAIMQQITREGLMKFETKKRNRSAKKSAKCLCPTCECRDTCDKVMRKNCSNQKEKTENV